MEKQINIIGKVVIIAGRKAKVINRSGNEITAVFQENGDYKKGNKVVKTSRSLITFLDQRKHPEKYLFSEEQKNIIAWCEMMVNNIEDQNKPTGLDYINMLKNRLQEAKDIGIDVSDIEDRMDELTKLAATTRINMMVNNIEDQNKPTGLDYINMLKNRLQEAKDIGIDVSDIEDRMNELTKLAA